MTYGHSRTYIDKAGRAKGIDVDDERTLDGGDWPKVIFDSQVESSSAMPGWDS
jgi:hypothetical protein